MMTKDRIALNKEKTPTQILKVIVNKLSQYQPKRATGMNIGHIVESLAQSARMSEHIGEERNQRETVQQPGLSDRHEPMPVYSKNYQAKSHERAEQPSDCVRVSQERQSAGQ